MAGPLALHYQTADGARRRSFCEEVRLGAGAVAIVEGSRVTTLLAFDLADGCLRHGSGQTVSDVRIGRRDGGLLWSMLGDQPGRPRATLAAVGGVLVRPPSALGYDDWCRAGDWEGAVLQVSAQSPFSLPTALGPGPRLRLSPLAAVGN